MIFHLPHLIFLKQTSEMSSKVALIRIVASIYNAKPSLVECNVTDPEYEHSVRRVSDRFDLPREFVRSVWRSRNVKQAVRSADAVTRRIQEELGSPEGYSARRSAGNARSLRKESSCTSSNSISIACHPLNKTTSLANQDPFHNDWNSSCHIMKPFVYCAYVL